MKRQQSHSLSNWYSITQKTAFTEYFSISGLSIIQLVVVLVHCQAWCWLKIPIPTQFYSWRSNGIFVFHSRPWCQELIEFIPSSSRAKHLPECGRRMESPFIFTPAASAERGFAGGQKHLRAPQILNFLKGPPRIWSFCCHISFSLKRCVRHKSLQSPAELCQHCQKGVGKEQHLS